MAFLEILNDHFLTQLNFIPTRRDRVLDLVITNVPDRVRVREVLSPKESDVFTDHCTVSFPRIAGYIRGTAVRIRTDIVSAVCGRSTKRC